MNIELRWRRNRFRKWCEKEWNGSFHEIEIIIGINRRKIECSEWEISEWNRRYLGVKDTERSLKVSVDSIAAFGLR